MKRRQPRCTYGGGAGTSYAAIAYFTADVAAQSMFFCGVIVDYTIDPVLATAG